MKRYLFGLCLASLGVPSQGTAREVVAKSGARLPIAVSSATERGHLTPQPTSPLTRSAGTVPAVQLGHPRLLESVSGVAGVIQPISHREPTAAGSLESIPPPVPVPSLLPEAVAVPFPYHRASPAPINLAEGSDSLFAVERVALFHPEPARMPSADSPEPLHFAPQCVHPEVLTEDVCSPGLVADSQERTRIYGSAEYLMWWTRSANVPPLVTTSEPVDSGFIGLPTTQILFGGDQLDQDLQHGGRFRLGYWLASEKPLAIEASFFFLSSGSAAFSADSSATRQISRPFFSLNRNQEIAQIVSSPGELVGRIDIDTPSNLYGGDLNLRCPLGWADDWPASLKVDLLGGFRFVHLDDKLSITEQGLALPTARRATPGQGFLFNDTFEARNNFYGGQLGMLTEWNAGAFSVGLRGTVALGVTSQRINVTGQANLFNADGTTLQLPGGLLTTPTNIGQYSRHRFSVVPEATLTLGYQLTDWLKATAGYNVLYWTSVVRAAEQVDRGLDERQIPFFLPPGVQLPDPARRGPVMPFKDNSFWAQGFTFGMELRY